MTPSWPHHSEEEILAVLAHEAGHWKKRHVLKQVLALEALSLLGFFVVAAILRRDGLEVIFASNRTGTIGLADLWVSTRHSTRDPWSPPVNLGPLVNSVGEEFHPTLSSEGTTLIFAHSDQIIPLGNADLYMCTRTKLHDQE